MLLIQAPNTDIGVLLQGGSSAGGGDNLGLIVGVAVAVPLAVFVVLVIITGGLLGTWYSKRRWSRKGGIINLDREQDDDRAL